MYRTIYWAEVAAVFSSDVAGDYSPDLCPGVIQLLAGDLPEGVDFVSLQLEVVALLAFPVELLAESLQVALHLFARHVRHSHAIDYGRALGRPLALLLASFLFRRLQNIWISFE